MLKDYRKIGNRLDTRFPITLQILHKFMHVAPLILSSLYEVSLFRAMCVFGIFRWMVGATSHSVML